MEKLARVLYAEDSVNDVELTLAAFEETNLLYHSFQLGVNAFVVKPIDFSDFVKAIKGIGYFWAILNISPTK